MEVEGVKRQKVVRVTGLYGLGVRMEVEVAEDRVTVQPSRAPPGLGESIGFQLRQQMKGSRVKRTLGKSAGGRGEVRSE